MNKNDKNDTGQEKVVTKGRLEEYVSWINSTSGESFVEIAPINTAAQTFRITVNPAFSNYSSGPVWIHWRNTGNAGGTGDKNVSGTTVDDNRLYIDVSGPNGYNFTPIGNMWIDSNGYAGKTLQLEDIHNINDSYGEGFRELIADAYTPIQFSGNTDDKPSGYCLTYSDITEGKYAQYWNSGDTTDGIVVKTYSIGDSKHSYDDNQLVVERDVSFGNFNYNLEVSSITVEIDAMTDMDEYSKGFVPYTDQNIRFASVVNKVEGGADEVFYGYDIKSGSSESSLVNIVDNSDTKDVRYGSTSTTTTYSTLTSQHLHIEKNGKVATAAKIDENKWQVKVYYYNGNNTLTSTTVTASTTGSGAFVRSGITVSSAITLSNKTANVFIERSSGKVYFDILQRKETYGYFPVDVYRQGSDKYAVDASGNVTSDSYFIEANMENKTPYYMPDVVRYSTGWLDNAGDNFGQYALTEGKKDLLQNEESVYNPVMNGQGIDESGFTLCGQDVYNANAKIYDRGVVVNQNSDTEYHMAYANDVYSLTRTWYMGNESGLTETSHLFIHKGHLGSNDSIDLCTDGNPCYSYDPFISDAKYDASYVRTYLKDMHAYGKTSIMRRFRIIGDEIDDTASAFTITKANTNNYNATVDYSYTIAGDKFPKHIYGKTMKYVITYSFEEANTIKSGEHMVSAWTTAFEDKMQGTSLVSYDEPTTRNVRVVFNDSENYYEIDCQANEKSNVYYLDIVPKFYMVDAETCDGICSAYTFETSDYITDATDTESGSGVFERRDYELISVPDLKSSQSERVDMLTYLNVQNANTSYNQGSSYLSGFTPVFENVKRSTYGVSVKKDCSPRAPLQEVYWIDSYAPTEMGGLITGTSVVTYLDDDNVSAGTPSGRGVLTPCPYSWDYFGDEITLNDVNKFDFEDETEAKYSFAGECVYYSWVSTNNSSHNIKDSVTGSFGTYNDFMRGQSDEDKYLGYAPYYGSYTDPMNAVEEGDQNFDGNVYSGVSVDSDDIEYDYVHFTRPYASSSVNKVINQVLESDTNPTYHKYLPLTTMLDGYKSVRPCHGPITVPSWTTDIRFGIRYANEVSNTDPISDFNLKIEINGVTLTPNTQEVNGVRYQLITDYDNDKVTAATVDGEAISGIYAYLAQEGDSVTSITKNGETITGFGTYALLNVKILVLDYSNTVVVRVKGDNFGDWDTAYLQWQLDGSYENFIPVETLKDLSSKGWYNYKDNRKLDGNNQRFSCIGINQPSQKSAARVFSNYTGWYFNAMTYDNDSTDIDTNYSVKATDYFGNYPTTHEGLYW